MSSTKALTDEKTLTDEKVPGYVRVKPRVNPVVFLNDTGLDVLPAFMRLQGNMIVAGSSVLQMITGDKWDDSDIDVWYKGEISDVFDALEMTGWTLLDACMIEDLGPSKLVETYKRLKDTVKSVLTFTKDGFPNVQFIELRERHCHSKRTLLDTVGKFDLSIVKVWYDGKSVFAFDQEVLRHILDRTFTLPINSELFTEREGKRIVKYKGRGFTWANEREAERYAIEKYFPSFRHFLTVRLKDKYSVTAMGKTFTVVDSLRLVIVTEDDTIYSVWTIQWIRIPVDVWRRPMYDVTGLSCVDFIEFEEHAVRDYIVEQAGNIVFAVQKRPSENLDPTEDPDNWLFTCYTHKELVNTLSEPTFTYYECKATTGGALAATGDPVVVIHVHGVRTYVKAIHFYLWMLDGMAPLIILVPTDRVFERSISEKARSASYGAFVSADHCQAGTDKRIWRMVNTHYQQY